MRFGVHCSLKNGLSVALAEAKEKKCEALQIFTRSPRMWKMSRHTKSEMDAFKKLRAELAIFPLAVHIPYLPNIATSKKSLYKRSIDALVDDLKVARQIGADFVVIHPGAYSENATPEGGIKKIIRALNHALSKAGGKCKVLIETVAGGGRRLGGTFEEINSMIRGVTDTDRVGVCLDTAHVFAAGYDLSKPRGTDRMLLEFDRAIGLERLKMVHFNDSIAPCGSKKDRHQHLGGGYIGAEGFKYLVRKLGGIAEAGILETPKEPEGSDRKNLSLLYKWRGPAGKGR